MANIANFVLADGQATPVNRTFSYVYRESGVVYYEERSAGVAAGFRKITISWRPGTTRNAGYKVSLKIQDPRLAVTAPASGSGVQPNPVVAYKTVFEASWFLDSASDLQARKDIYAFAKNLLAKVDIQNMIENLDAPN